MTCPDQRKESRDSWASYYGQEEK